METTNDVRFQEIARTLSGAVESAAESLCDLGLDADEAGAFITDTWIGCDWSAYFDDTASATGNSVATQEAPAAGSVRSEGVET